MASLEAIGVMALRDGGDVILSFVDEEERTVEIVIPAAMWPAMLADMQGI